MKLKIVILSVSVPAILFSVGCQSMNSKSPTAPSPIQIPATPSPHPTDTVLVSSPTAEPTTGSKIISAEKLNCTPLGEFAKCIDETLGIQFEQPIAWGEIEAVLRTGWDSGYAYKYSFISETISESHLPEAAGLSIDFAEGREIYPLDFAGFGNESLLQTNSCEQQDLYPICEEVSPDIRWMIRFPNARYFCESTHRNTSPIFRIEVNLPDNPTVNGFVFMVPFLSENLFDEIKRDIYPLFLVEPELIPSYPESCYPENRQPFDDQVEKVIERIKTNNLDGDTLRNMNDLKQLAESIVFR